MYLRVIEGGKSNASGELVVAVPHAVRGGDATHARPVVLYHTDGPKAGLARIRIQSQDDEHFAEDTGKLWECDTLNDWERNFVRSVREYHARNRQISERQKAVVDRMCSRHLRKRKPK